jgi:hypothetical protein
MIAPCLHIRFRILHDRKQTTVLFCIAVCDTYAVGVDHTNLFYILLNLFFFKFKKIKRDLSGAYELKELKVSSAFSSSSQHQIMSTLQVMVNFITFQKAIHGLALSDDICIALKKRCLCNVADVYTKRSIVRCDRLDDRPYKSSFTDHRRVSDIRTFDTRIGRFRRPISRRQMEGICDTEHLC